MLDISSSSSAGAGVGLKQGRQELNAIFMVSDHEKGVAMVEDVDESASCLD